MLHCLVRSGSVPQNTMGYAIDACLLSWLMACYSCGVVGLLSRWTPEHGVVSDCFMILSHYGISMTQTTGHPGDIVTINGLMVRGRFWGLPLRQSTLKGLTGIRILSNCRYDDLFNAATVGFLLTLLVFRCMSRLHRQWSVWNFVFYWRALACRTVGTTTFPILHRSVSV